MTFTEDLFDLGQANESMTGAGEFQSYVYSYR